MDTRAVRARLLALVLLVIGPFIAVVLAHLLGETSGLSAASSLTFLIFLVAGLWFLTSPAAGLVGKKEAQDKAEKKKETGAASGSLGPSKRGSSTPPNAPLAAASVQEQEDNRRPSGQSQSARSGRRKQSAKRRKRQQRKRR